METTLPSKTLLHVAILVAWFAAGAAIGVALPTADADARVGGRGGGDSVCEDRYEHWDLLREAVEAEGDPAAEPALLWSSAAWLTAGGDEAPVYFRSNAANLDGATEAQ